MKATNLTYVFKERHVYQLKASPLAVRGISLGQKDCLLIEANDLLMSTIVPVNGVYKQYFKTTGKSFKITDDFLFMCNGWFRCLEDIVILLHSDESGKYMECLLDVKEVEFKREVYRGVKKWHMNFFLFKIDKILLKGVNLKLSDDIYTIEEDDQ